MNEDDDGSYDGSEEEDTAIVCSLLVAHNTPVIIQTVNVEKEKDSKDFEEEKAIVTEARTSKLFLTFNEVSDND